MNIQTFDEVSNCKKNKKVCTRCDKADNEGGHIQIMKDGYVWLCLKCSDLCSKIWQKLELEHFEKQHKMLYKFIVELKK